MATQPHKKLSAFDSFDDLFGPPKESKKKPARKKSKKQKFIVKEYVKEELAIAPSEPLPENKPASSFQKIADKIEGKLYEPPRAAIPTENLPPPIQPYAPPKISIRKVFKFLRKLRSWIANPFVDKMIEEVNKRLETFQKHYDDKFAEMSYNAYKTGAVSFGGGGGGTVVQQITGPTGAPEELYYNNSIAVIDDKVLVTLSDNDLTDDTTTIKLLLNGEEEPLGVSVNTISPDTEGQVLRSGTITIPFNTTALPIGTLIYVGPTGEFTTTINKWIVGKTVNSALNGKIYIKIERANVGSFNEDDILIDQFGEILNDNEINVVIGKT